MNNDPNAQIRRTQEFLFASEEEMQRAGLPMPMRKRIIRLRDIYLYWLNFPKLREKAIVLEVKRRYGVGDSMAYDDVRLVKTCLGTLNKATTEYYRWLFIERCEEAFQMARDKGDPSAFAKVLSALGKYTGLDKDESRVPDYSLIVPQPFEITADATVAGFKAIPNIEDKARKMLDRFIKEAKEQPEVIEVQPLRPEFHHQEDEEEL